jgi:hypothetical protein
LIVLANWEVGLVNTFLSMRVSLLMVTGALLLAAVSRAQAAIPTEPAKESPHPPAIVLWPNGAPGSEARKDEPEKLDWREEPENNIVFPILFNIHNPSIVPFIPDPAKATGAAVVIAPGGGHMFPDHRPGRVRPGQVASGSRDRGVRAEVPAGPRSCGEFAVQS